MGTRKVDSRTYAQKNRAKRQEEVRQELAAKGKIQYIFDNLKKIEEAVGDPDTVQRLKVATDIRLKLLAKYLPDLKAVEVTGEAGEALTIKVVDFSGGSTNS